MHLKWEKVDIVMTGAVYSQRGLLLCWRVELWGGGEGEGEDRERGGGESTVYSGARGFDYFTRSTEVVRSLGMVMWC